MEDNVLQESFLSVEELARKSLQRDKQRREIDLKEAEVRARELKQEVDRRSVEIDDKVASRRLFNAGPNITRPRQDNRTDEAVQRPRGPRIHFHGVSGGQQNGTTPYDQHNPFRANRSIATERSPVVRNDTSNVNTNSKDYVQQKIQQQMKLTRMPRLDSVSNKEKANQVGAANFPPTPANFPAMSATFPATSGKSLDGEETGNNDDEWASADIPEVPPEVEESMKNRQQQEQEKEEAKIQERERLSSNIGQEQNEHKTEVGQASQMQDPRPNRLGNEQLLTSLFGNTPRKLKSRREDHGPMSNHPQDRMEATFPIETPTPILKSTPAETISNEKSEDTADSQVDGLSTEETDLLIKLLLKKQAAQNKSTLQPKGLAVSDATSKSTDPIPPKDDNNTVSNSIGRFTPTQAVRKATPTSSFEDNPFKYPEYNKVLPTRPVKTSTATRGNIYDFKINQNVDHSRFTATRQDNPFGRVEQKPQRQVICKHCGQPGHVAFLCPQKQNDDTSTSSQSTADAGLKALDDLEEKLLTGKDHGRKTAMKIGISAPYSKQSESSQHSVDPTHAQPEKRSEVETKHRESRADHWANTKNDRADSTRSRHSAGTFEHDRSSRRTRQRRNSEDDMDDVYEPSKNKNKRLARSAQIDDDDQPTRHGLKFGQRQVRDDMAETLEESEGLRQIRQRRQREREAKYQKRKADQDRKVAIAAKRASALTRISLPHFITVSRLAQTLGVKMTSFVRRMQDLGFNETAHDHVLSGENASLIALEYNFDPVIGGDDVTVQSKDLTARPEMADPSNLPNRPPIVTIMGHVDHGKTTILDYLRKSSIAASEHGGITQHIGAFSVRMSDDKIVTFLDTPGHAAFLSMRKRGANVTDIVILVVAADDSVKPQTLEALKHATEAKVPIIVAVNKIDKPEADLNRVKQDLARHGVEIEEYGGDVQVIPVSGKTGQGMDDLEEAVSTLSEILDHRAEVDGLVEGWVLEATTKAAGRVATVLVRRGTLAPGDIIVAGQTWGRVKTLQNEAGIHIDQAGPGTPVEVDGWRDQPIAGDLVLETDSEQRATEVVQYRETITERSKLAEDVTAINEFRRVEQEKRDKEKSQDTSSLASSVTTPQSSPVDIKSVPFIIKADVSGSAEAVASYLQQLINPLCSPRILRSNVGPVSQFDIDHAYAAGGHIISFNQPQPSGDIASKAENAKVKILEQNVIYRVLEQVKDVLEEKLEPIVKQRVVGEAEVLKCFDIGLGGRKTSRIAGARVKNGEVKRGSKVRVSRGGNKVYDGKFDILIPLTNHVDANSR